MQLNSSFQTAALQRVLLSTASAHLVARAFLCNKSLKFDAVSLFLMITSPLFDVNSIEMLHEIVLTFTFPFHDCGPKLAIDFMFSQMQVLQQWIYDHLFHASGMLT